jgi:hypothetical protein
MSQTITKAQWAKAYAVISGWRRWSCKRDTTRPDRIAERNRKEVEAGRVPQPPIGEQVAAHQLPEYSGRNWIDPDLLDYTSVERWLDENGDMKFRRFLKHHPASPTFTNTWRVNAGVHEGQLETLIVSLNVGPKPHCSI